jgi:hypothetical protein
MNINNIKRVLWGLADVDLLKRCLDQKTQYSNESVSSVIQTMLSKTVFLRLK